MSFFVALSLCVNYVSNRNTRASDAYIRDRVLMLLSEVGQCSAVQVKAPSGKIYALSAAHCVDLLVKGSITAINEQGVSKQLRFVAIDEEHDLLLLTPFDNKSINIAKSTKLYDKIHTLTHGNGQPTYRTDGELLKEKSVETGSPIESEEQLVKCDGRNKKILETFAGLYCVKTLTVSITTAQVVGGSSGGPALNKDGELIGIVSVATEIFSGVIPLKEIQTFLKAR